MRLAWKLSLALMPVVLGVLASSAYVRLQRELVLFQEDTRRDQRIIATTLARAAETLWARQGPEAALDVIRDADAARSGMSIRWVSLEPSPDATKKPTLTGSRLAGLTEHEPLQVLLEVPPQHTWDDPEESLVTYALAMSAGERLGAVEVAESLAPASVYLGQTRRNTIVLTVILALACILVIGSVGHFLITRPVKLLIERAHEIGQGLAIRPLALRQRDELGELAGALDQAAKSLSDATQLAKSEEAARLAAQEQLRHAERLATAGKLASALAHEIGTPLNVASGHAQLIAQKRVDVEQAVESAAIIKGQCDRIAKLVRQLLDFATRRPPNLASANLTDITRVTVELLGHLAKRRDVTLVFEAVEDGIAVVDTFQTQQALTNVVMNAIQASAAQQRVTVTLTKQKRSDHSHPECKQEYVVVSVRDDGPGIAASDIEHIFEPFFTTKASGEGTGLGLSITRDIIREHGGFIAVSSEAGSGTRFDLCWPAGVAAA
jgi:two-component system, NtrC family, sensor kinase